ncbi:MAG: RsmB/NOP family class I SAM-dependent RNA methyltransferase [Opitutaceae bacterium]|nr:RsmB/NOP family class I SAM-dependent RNA methyltransferase [Opitutaceae bacterium]
MFDPSTLNRAAHVIRGVTPRLPADSVLRLELAANRALSPAARSAVSRAVFSYYRWIKWLNRHDSIQAQVNDALERQARHERDPTAIKLEALAARAVPEWLAAETALPPETLRLLQLEPVLWIRARPGMRTALAQELNHCELPSNLSPDGALAAEAKHALRFFGKRDLFTTGAFQRGAFEIQDIASQLVGHACAPNPGEVWWDACAGEGGKSLHLADLMANQGTLWASDRSSRRLEQLRRRFARAQLFNVRVAPWEEPEVLPTRTLFDGVLLDAPCSGVGTWQRNPHARWTTKPQDVLELAGVQARLLNLVARQLKPGGRLIYSVCTLTRSETTAVADAFTAANPDMIPDPVFSHASFPQTTLWPHEFRSNGMFIAAWRRQR